MDKFKGKVFRFDGVLCSMSVHCTHGDMSNVYSLELNYYFGNKHLFFVIMEDFECIIDGDFDEEVEKIYKKLCKASKLIGRVKAKEIYEKYKGKV